MRHLVHSTHHRYLHMHTVRWHRSANLSANYRVINNERHKVRPCERHVMHILMYKMHMFRIRIVGHLTKYMRK